MVSINKQVMSKQAVIGVTALLLSALLTSLSQVYYANKVQAIHPFLFTGVSFLLTAIFFTIIHKSQRNVRASNRTAMKDIIMLNGSSILAFMGFYYALKYLEPAIVSSLEMGVGPLFAIILTATFTKSKIQASRAQWIITIGTFFSSLLLILTTLLGLSGVTIAYSFSFIFGIICSVVCGIGAVLCTIYSKRLSTAGWSSSKILAYRFYGIIFISLLLTYDQLTTYLLSNIQWIVIMTICGVIIPMYLLQKGIQYCDTFFVMMSICFIPVFTFGFQLFDSRITWSTSTFLGILLLFCFGLASIFTENRAK